MGFALPPSKPLELNGSGFTVVSTGVVVVGLGVVVVGLGVVVVGLGVVVVGLGVVVVVVGTSWLLPEEPEEKANALTEKAGTSANVAVVARATKPTFIFCIGDMLPLPWGHVNSFTGGGNC